jgi:hypothetical protein
LRALLVKEAGALAGGTFTLFERLQELHNQQDVLEFLNLALTQMDEQVKRVPDVLREIIVRLMKLWQACEGQVKPEQVGETWI